MTSKRVDEYATATAADADEIIAIDISDTTDSAAGTVKRITVTSVLSRLTAFAWGAITGTPTTLGGYGITDAASDSELATHESDTTSVHGITDTSTLYHVAGTDVALADGGTGASLSDPNADRIAFWDDSAGSVAWLEVGTGLTISGTTIMASGGGNALTVEELDASPTDSAVTKIVFPNGTLGIVSHVATYTPVAGATVAVLPLDSRTLHTTYGDHFAASSLDAKWTRRNTVAGDEAYQIHDGSHMRVALYGGNASKQYHQSAPAGDFEVQMRMTMLGPNVQVIGPMIIDSAGNGVLASFNTTDNIFVIWTLSAYAYSSNIGTVAERTLSGGAGSYGAIPIWFAIRKVGTTYSARWSADGIAWSSYLTGSPAQTFTVHRIGFGRALNTATNWIDVDWFDVV